MIRPSRWRLKYRIFAGLLVVGLLGVVMAFVIGLLANTIYTDFRQVSVFSQRVELGRDLSAKMINLQRLSEEFVHQGKEFSASQARLVMEDARGKLSELQSGASVNVRNRASEMTTHLDEFEKAFNEVERQRIRQNRLVEESIRSHAAEHGEVVRKLVSGLPDQSPKALEAEKLHNLVLLIERLVHQYFDTLDNALIGEVRSNLRLAKGIVGGLGEGGDASPAVAERLSRALMDFQKVVLEAIQRTRGYLYLVNVVMAAETNEVLYQANRLADELRAEMTLIEARVADKIRDVYVTAFTGSLLILAVILVLSWGIGRSIAAPIESLAGTFRRLARGESPPSLKLSSASHELGELSSAAAVFHERNRETEQLLVKYRDLSEELEARVRERTKELEGANFKLQRLSRTDGLTGLSNRRYFEEILEREWAAACRHDLCLAAIMLDIDYFKPFNDMYGHQAGDDCLRQVARVFDNSLRRGNDLVARYGGEEFVVLLPDTHHKQAVEIAELLRESISGLEVQHEGSPWQKLTASVGVAVYGAASGIESPFELIKRADRALYQAKHRGRNQVYLATYGQQGDGAADMA